MCLSTNNHLVPKHFWTIVNYTSCKTLNPSWMKWFKSASGPGRGSLGPGKNFFVGLFWVFSKHHVTLGPFSDLTYLSLSLASGRCAVRVSRCIEVYARYRLERDLWYRGMWAVGENCATAMKFEILGFYRYGGQASAHIVCSDGPGPSIFFRGGGGFSTPGWASLGEISILKIIVFLMIFLSFLGIFILCCFIQ